MKSGIYKITNTVNNKYYIGSSVNIHKRWISHKCDLNKQRHPNKHLQYSFNKHGFDCFKFEVLEYCDRPLLKETEQKFLDMLYSKDQCYNILKESYSVHGENHTMFGRTHTAEARLKIKEARSKQTIKHSLETRRKIGEGNKGRPINMNHINNMVKARNGIAWNKGLKIGTNKNHILSDEKIKNIISDYKDGLSINQVKDKYKMSWKRVKIVLKENNIKTRTISQEKQLRDERRVKKVN